MSVVLDNLDLFFRGMRQTATLTLVSFAIAFVVGVVMAGFRVSPVPPLRAVGTVYVTIVRNTPLPVLMLLFFIGFPKIGILYSPFTSSIIVLSAYTGTFVAETVRAGVNSVSVGQAEAARSLGMPFRQVLGVVILPQALRTVVQPLGSIFIALIKNSALATIIGVPNLGKSVGEIAVANASYVPVYLGAAVAYLLLTLPSGQAVGWIERRVAIRR
ncbi:MAG: glutamate transport system permease protein [Actinomycetota bacterium]|jgi:glutamate transport system permease protein|nr:glutamate transport system permease protein [Actinomycetota bacterium]